MIRLLGATASICLLLAVNSAGAQVAPSATGGLKPNIEGQTDMPLRYRPEGGDFVIRNGTEVFNRALYGGNTAFRVDGGDKPEFSLYLPGRGGNVRLGIKAAHGVIWLSDASHIVTRYRPGELIYVITDPLLGRGRLEVAVLAYHQTEGLIVRAEGQGLPAGAELIFAYGGGNGVRGVRDGDIGTEKVPISQYFQFKPEYAADDRYALTKGGFTVDGKAARFAGVVSTQAELRLADAAQWADANALLSSSPDAAVKVVVGQVKLGGTPVFLSVQVTSRPQAGDLSTYSAVTAPRGNTPAQAQGVSPLDPAYKPSELAKRFNATRRHFETLRNRVRVETPDPYLDAAVGALNVAADALWDERQGGIMHGAIAWRTKLLGWRGPYALDALGWHDRARRNFDGWTVRQNTDAMPEALPPADEDSNLARNEVGLHSNGDMSNSHYDMNIGFIDALFRHILWTGDLDYARKSWPVIERHLAWEKRLFRREYGPEKLPLYEAYAAIWASDDMQYHGGGVAYTSAYNLYHNRMAARIAGLLGKDDSAYAREAELIGRGMRQYLWMPDRGAFAEFRDLLGGQMIHPSYGLWSFYHTLDSGVPDGFEAAQMAADLERHLKPIPVTGEGVPIDRPYHVLPSSDWMPYSWSLNNVVMGENLHTALALWQAGDVEDAYTLTRGSLLASFYMGIAPGNIGSLNYLDTYRREAQRDFADGAGVMSRTVVEGLFGVKPDALDKTLRLTPGFPKGWNHASLSHPDLGLSFKRDGANETWTVSQTGTRFASFVIDVPVTQEGVDAVTIDGKEVRWTAVKGVGAPKLRIEGELKKQAVVKVAFKGAALDPARAEVIGTGPDTRFTAHRQGNFEWWTLAAAPAPEQTACVLQASRWVWMNRLLKTEAVDLTASFNARVTEIFAPGKYRSPRSPYVSLAIPAQGIGAWAGHVNAMANIDDAALRAAGGEVRLPNGLTFRTPAEGPNIVFTSQWDNYPDEASVPLTGKAKHAYLMMAGSTNAMQSRVTNGEVVVTYSDGTEARTALANPQNWWPIERDYFIDDYQFQLCGEAPVRLDLKTGAVTIPGPNSKGRTDREKIDGGAANILDIELDVTRTLKSLTVRSVANEVVIGLMAVSLER